MRFNRLLCILTLSVCLVWIPTAGADWNGTISAANPLHWFSFEEAAGSAIADDRGSANMDGAYVGGVGLETPGLVGQAASFDGVDGHVLVGGPNLTGDWTVESILKADAVAGGPSQGILGNDFTAADRMALKAEQWNETGQLGYTVFGVIDLTFTGAAAATPADYAHVTFVGTGAGVDLYVNGAHVGSDTITTPLSRHVLGASAIRATGALIDPLRGEIDELVIYDRALSAAEISGHVAAIPEPGSLVLLAVGAVALAGFAIRRRRA